MKNYEHYQALSEGRHPLISLLIVILFAFSGFQAIGPIIGILATLPFFDLDPMQALEQISNPVGNDQVKIPIFLIQGIASALGFIIIPLIYLRKVEKKSLVYFLDDESLKSYPILLLTFITLSFMFVNSVFVLWNENIILPEFMAGLEEKLRYLEDAARVQTEFLTSFDSFGHFFLAFIVIAVIPAIGEELLFRGFVQNYLIKFFKNIHLAIWVAAFLFSAFHLQFFGLLPRMLLGVVFGYLYYWSKNLAVPIIAHFINNGFTILMMYLYQQEFTKMDIENEDSLPWPFITILFFLFLGLSFLYKNYFQKHFQQ